MYTVTLVWLACAGLALLRTEDREQGTGVRSQGTEGQGTGDRGRGSGVGSHIRGA